MDPLTAIAGIGLIGSLASGLANLIPTKADIEANKRRKELQALEKADALGLTDRQRMELQALGMEPIQAGQRELRARAPEMIGLQEIGAGGTLIRQEAQQEGIKEATRQLGSTLAQLDREAAAQQKAELENLKAQRQATQAFQKQAAIETAQDVIVGASQVAASAQQAKMQGLLQNNERALRNAISADLQSQKAYIQDAATGKQRFNPAFNQQLQAIGFRPDQIAILETMPQDYLIEYFLREQFRMPSATIGFGPDRFASPVPFTNPTYGGQ